MDSVHETDDQRSIIVNETEVVTNADRPPLLSWSAVFGGLVFVLSISWLLHLLGLALGVSIADVSDGEALGNGLTIGAIVWIVLSWLIAFFIGSLLTARLSGKVDDTAGMLHGMTLWGVTTALTLVLGYWGVSGMMQTGFSVAQSTLQTAGSAISGVSSGVSSSAGAIADSADTKLANNIKARLKRRASRIISNAESEGGANVSAEEVRKAIDEMDEEAMGKIAQHVASGEMTRAREDLVNATNLNNDQVKEILNGIEQQFEEQLGMGDNDTELSGDISKALTSQVSDLVASLDDNDGVEVSKADVREAMKQMDRETMQTVSMRLVSGDPQGAKDALVANTDLSSQQINAIVDGVNDDVRRTVDRYQKKANEAIEAGTSYAQAVLWTVFVAASMGLAVSLLGGWMGTESTRRLTAEVRRVV